MIPYPYLQTFSDTMHRYDVPVVGSDHPPRPAGALHRPVEPHVRPELTYVRTRAITVKTLTRSSPR